MPVTLDFSDGTSLVLDAAISQHHERNAEITKHPVEDGADITDHIRPQPKGVNIQGLMSTVPLLSAGEVPDENRHIDAYKVLDHAITARLTVTVTTGLETYKNMAIRHIAFPRENANVDLFFTIELEEVLFAKSKTVQVPKSAIGPLTATAAAVKTLKQQAGKKAAIGNVAVKAPNAAQAVKASAAGVAARPKSILKAGLQWVQK